MRRAWRNSRPVLLLAGGYALLALAWMVAQPAFGSPDEDHHYVRVLGVAEGDLIGEQAPWDDPAATPRQLAWARQATRAFAIPTRMSPRPGACAAGAPEPGDCPISPVATPVGTYQPLPYLLPAVLVGAGNDPESGDRLARLGGVISWVALLGLAAALLWDRRRGAVSLLGLAVAVTPMAVFLGATLNGSGLEIAAAVGFAAGLLRLARGDLAEPWVLASIAVCGALLALSRSTGPLWVILDLLVFVLLVGPRASLSTLASRPRWTTATAVLLVAAVGLNRVWEATHGPTVTSGLTPVGDAAREVHVQAADAMASAIGWFGALEVRPPAIVYVVWTALVAGLVLLALRAATRRERITLIAVTLAAAAVPALLIAAVLRHTGFPLQGRHVLPLCVVVPLLAGEVLRRHAISPARWQGRAIGAAYAVGAAVQALCFYAGARFAAVGDDGPWWFLGEADWAPPLGWGAWLVTAGAGAALIAAAGLRRAEPG